jgi:hypothetical protein
MKNKEEEFAELIGKMFLEYSKEVILKRQNGIIIGRNGKPMLKK